MKNYYQFSAEEVKQDINGKQEPLTAAEVKAHQEKFGPNELVEGKKKTTLQIFLEQYKDFLVIILIAAAIVSGFLGDAESAIVILIVITINAILGTVQTVKAEQSLASLKKLSGPEAKVLRDGSVVQFAVLQKTLVVFQRHCTAVVVPHSGTVFQIFHGDVYAGFAVRGIAVGAAGKTGAEQCGSSRTDQNPPERIAIVCHEVSVPFDDMLPYTVAHFRQVVNQEHEIM